MQEKRSVPVNVQFLLVHEEEGNTFKPKLLNRGENVVGQEVWRILQGGKIFVDAMFKPDEARVFKPFEVTVYDRNQDTILTDELYSPGLYKLYIRRAKDGDGRPIRGKREGVLEYDSMKQISERKFVLSMVDNGNPKSWIRFVVVETPEGKVGAVEFHDGSLLDTEGNPVKTGKILTGAREGERYRGRQISMANRWRDHGGRKPTGLHSLNGRIAEEISETLKLADAVYTAKDMREFPLFREHPDVLVVRKLTPVDFDIRPVSK